MGDANKAYLEHVAIWVKDIDWHVRFFADVLGMSIREQQGANDARMQVWLVGGIQLMADPGFEAPEARLAHLGMMVEDLERAIGDARRRGARTLPQGRNWLALPDGLSIELIQAQPDSVSAALAVKSRP